MPTDEDPLGRSPSRRTVLIAGGATFVALTATGGVLAAAARTRPRPAGTPSARVPSPTPTPTATVPPPPPPLVNPPTAGIELHPADTSTLQCLTPVPETGEWFTTQARTGTSALADPFGLAVGDLVVSRLTADGALIDSMTLPDSGHGMGLVVRVEQGARILYSCWFAPDASGRLYDVVRLPYVPGTAARLAATPVVPGLGFPLDPSYDASTDTVTLRHQGGSGPQYTRHRWADFAAGDLSQPIGQIATPDSPPVQQGFCSFGDRFFFYTGSASGTPGGDPVLITEYSWSTGQVTAPPLDASGNSRQADGTYLGGRMEPEGAAILVDGAGSASLVVGLTNGGGPARTPRTFRTFRYPLASA